MLRRFLAFVFLLALCSPVHALESKARQAILIDDSTGTVLFEKSADESMHPSSMSKLMTLYVVFNRLKEGGLKLEDQFPVSETAWSKQGSKSFMALGSYVSVEDLLRSIIIQSGNDACIVIAEGLAGSEENFAKEMNATAQKIGLENSHFVNATGWPDDGHLMTARDLASLGRHLIHDFPEYYHYFSELEFTYNGIRQHNRNLLLNGNIGVDGLKTGHTEIAGYGIVASAKDAGGRRLITVVNGLADEKERAAEAETLLRAGFRDYASVTLAKKGAVIENLPVWMGEKAIVPAVSAEDMTLILSRMGKDQVEFKIRYASPITAPVAAGAPIAELLIVQPGQPTQTRQLVAGEAVERLGLIGRAWHNFSYYLLGKKPE